ncbi:hypothetical protein LX97_00324 [Nonlabens dokdonensis]|jgi:hypothetical protein|uniref:Protease complex subunit PrcB family protein n=2 Tax=Nonlabens dokdonensis TaxID=328515 RepID=L7W618_NONDD|nr:hypothetical protein [Nonlabens dokdonensis]AGC75632.1 hypothetical protein DDD_0505 [Nonlabens dokdonensis DSW-6]PZX43324.1 hypothetical protein LX97_00324 [Nonlabens dokdonensis]
MKNCIFLLSLFLFISCNNDDDVSEPEIQTGPISFVEIGRGKLNGFGSEGILKSNLIIDNSTDWINLINQMDSDVIISRLTETNIDFNNYTVIAVFDDVFTEVYFIEITSMIENQNDITVTTVLDGGGFTAVSQPFHIVKIPKTTKPFVFL